MARTMQGTVTIVQEGRFQLTDDDGVGHLFILGHLCGTEASQLPALQRRQARVRVSYTPAQNLIGNLASALYVAV